MQTLSLGWEEYLEADGISEKDLFLFYYNRKKLEQQGTSAIWLNYFIQDWDPYVNAEFSKKYGLHVKDNLNPNEIGSYHTYTALDSNFNPVNQMLKFIKFGFGQCMDQVCYDIRTNRISRDEGIELIKKYDGKCSEKYIDAFCDYADINTDEFWNTTEKFRGKMWYKKNNDWQNSYWDEF